MSSQQLKCFGSRRWLFIDIFIYVSTISDGAFLVLQYSIVILRMNSKYLKAAQALLSVCHTPFVFISLVILFYSKTSIIG